MSDISTGLALSEYLKAHDIDFLYVGEGAGGSLVVYLCRHHDRDKIPSQFQNCRVLVSLSGGARPASA